MQKYNQELKKNFTGFTPGAAELLLRYPWPGNIRELRNVVERSMILTSPRMGMQFAGGAAPVASDGEIDADALPEEIRDLPAESVENAGTAEVLANGGQFVTLRELEERYINEVLVACHWNKAQAARILGIHPTSILRRLKKTEEKSEGVAKSNGV